MKTKNKNLVRVSIIAACVIFIVAQASSLLPSTTVGFIMKAVQKVDYKAFENTEWANAKIGTTLGNGDEVKTGQRSLAIIKFKDNSLLRVRENSVVKMYGEQKNKLVDKNTEIKIGKVGFEVTKQKGEEFKFTTPTMVASIKGTSGYFDITETGSLLFVETGIIEIESTVGARQKQTITAGNVALVGLDGIVTLRSANAADIQANELSKKTKTTKVLIRTSDDEEYILEYLDKQ